MEGIRTPVAVAHRVVPMNTWPVVGTDTEQRTSDEVRRLMTDIDWRLWEETLSDRGITLDRPRGTAHPTLSEIIYPIDYGYVNGTVGQDGEEVDVFVGSADVGLVGAIVTVDHRKKDVELKLLMNCSPAEVYLVNGFINFDRARMEGTLVMRRPLKELWERSRSGGAR